MADRIRVLVLDAETTWAYHKERGKLGQIEAAASRIRHAALRDCWRIADPAAERQHIAPWENR